MPANTGKSLFPVKRIDWGPFRLNCVLQSNERKKETNT
jgi:hypothetical protein